MTRDEFLDKQHSLSVQSGMNQRYHQIYSTWWWRWDTAAKITTAILAVSGAMLAVGATFETHPPLIDSVGVLVASAAALAAVILNVVPFGTWEQEHRDLLRQWTDLREDVECLLFECESEPAEHHVCELKKLDAKMHRICGEEPSPNNAVIQTCFNAETKSRQPAAA